MRNKLAHIIRFKLHIWLTIIFFVVVIFLFGKLILKIDRLIKSTGLTPQAIVRLLFDGEANLQSTNGRTNILVLGIAGGSHAGADLTDTILILSLDLSKRTLALTSLPRDIWSDTLKDKINSAYHYGEEKNEGGGLVLAKVIAEEVMGMPLHYGLVINFLQFEKIIDLAGGVDVVVPTAFTDSNFPISGRENDLCDNDPEVRCRYESLHFASGLQHLNGELALKYVRSRHADGDEGTDFARSRRQQDVLLSLKEKLLKFEQWLPLTKITDFFKAMDEATDTDMKISELAAFGKLTLATDKTNIRRVSLEKQLTEGSKWQYDGRYVLVPIEDWETLHQEIQKQLNSK